MRQGICRRKKLSGHYYLLVADSRAVNIGIGSKCSIVYKKAGSYPVVSTVHHLKAAPLHSVPLLAISRTLPYFQYESVGYLLSRIAYD